MEQTFPVKLNLRIDWSEMDMFGHVNNVAYFKYVQASRVNYWEQTILAELHKNNNIGSILASTGCQFKLPLFYPGNITVQARVNFMKTTSFGIEHQILNEQGRVVAEAQDVIVVFDFNKHEKVAIPQELRQ